jgi:serine/threonine-protein phosphatase 2B regulatory subunit
MFIPIQVTEDEVKKLHAHFKSISTSIQDDGVIDLAEFQQALGLKNSAFADRLFHVFDLNKDDVINFKEFVCGLSVFCSKGTLEEKLQLSFRIYDKDEDGFIDKPELMSMLRAIMFDNLLFHLSEQHMQALVDSTFVEADTNGDGLISFQEYQDLVNKHPTILNSLTLNFTEAIKTD